MALMMLTMLPEGASVALSGICPGSSFGGGGRGVELLDRVLLYCGAGNSGSGCCEGTGIGWCEGIGIGCVYDGL